MSNKKRKNKAQRRPASAFEIRPLGIDQLSGRAKHFTAIGLLLVVSLTFFANFHFKGKTFAPSDTIGWRASAQSILEYQEKTGERALWATNMFAGMPAFMVSYAPRSVQLDTIANLLRRIIWPTSHFLFVLVGMYLLAFFVTEDWIASMLAAIGYGLTTYLPILILAGHNSKFIALCYAPWMVVSFLFALRKPGILASLLFAAAAAINLRAGHIQITYFFVIGVIILWIGAGIHAFRSGTSKEFAKATLFLVIGSFLALLMVAQPYLANVEYKAFSIRGASLDPTQGSGLGWENAMAWSQGRAELLTLLISDAFGGASRYWGPKSFTAGPHYVGGIMIVLAIVAVVRRRDWLVMASAVAAVLMIGFSLGENLAFLNRPAYNLLPLFSSFRAPETWLVAAAFFIALLAAVGLSEVLSLIRASSKLGRSVVGPWLVITVFTAILLAGSSSLFSFEKPGERARFAGQVASRENVSADDPRVTQAIDQFLSGLQQERIDAFQTDATRTLLLLAIAGLLIWIVSTRNRYATLAGLAVVLLVLVDLFGVGRRYLSEDRMVDSKDLTQQIPKYDFDEFILDEVEREGGMGHFRVLSLEGEPTTTARPSFYYESLGGYHGAKLRVYQDFIDNVLFSDGLQSIGGNASDVLNVGYVISPQQVPGFSRVYTSEQSGLAVYKNDSLPGRAFFVDTIVGVEPGVKTWEYVRANTFDAATVAVVTPPVYEALASRLSSDSTATDSVELERYGPREISWNLQTSHDRLLVISEIYYPKGWHAMVDGVDAPIHMVDGVIRGVVVPAGSKKLVMRFDPASDRIGGLVAAGATAVVYLGIFGLGLVEFRRKRSKFEQAPDATHE